MPLADTGNLLSVLLLLRVGQTLLLAGDVRSKNAAAVAVRCVLDLAVVTLVLWAVGGIFIPFGPRDLGPTRWLYWNHLLGNGGAPSLVVLLPMVLIATGAVVGGTAERIRLMPVLIVAAGLTVVLSVLWRVGVGWFDVGHANAIALTLATVGGGAAAITLAAFAGPRKGKFNRDQSVNFIPGHSLVFQLVGLLLLAAGWSALTRGTDGLLGLSAALLAGAGYGQFRFGKIDPGLMMLAGLGGLCAAGVLVASPYAGAPNLLGPGGGAAVLAGVLAGAVTPWAVILLDVRFRIDDVAGWSAAYLTGGTVGVVVAALTRRAGGFGDYLGGVAADAGFWLVAIIASGGFVYAVAGAFKGRLRVSETVEYDGLDLSELDINAYPDFQQTMIKSHHLRQL